MSLRCPNCDAVLDDNSAFCTECGAPIAAEPAAPIPAEPAAEPAAAAEPVEVPAPSETPADEPLAPPCPAEPAHEPTTSAPQPAVEPERKKGKDRRSARTEKPQPIESNQLPKNLRPLTTTAYVWLTLLFAFPGIGLIAMAICALPSHINRNVRHMARAWLLLLLIGIAVLVIAGLICYLLLWPQYQAGIMRVIAELRRMF